jgi:DNA repair exonuclease SbcCD ATPase subunit
MVYKKELEKTVKKLRTQVSQLEKMLEDEKQVSQLRLDSLLNQRDESDKLQDKIFELQQQIDAQETKGPVLSGL